MSATSPPTGGPPRDERLIDALIPSEGRRRWPDVPLIVPALPQLSLPVDEEPGSLLVDTARIDASGRFSARGLLRALTWQPQQRVDIAVVDNAVVVGAAPTGRNLVGSRGDLAIPASARELLSIGPGAEIVLVAAPRRKVLVVHPAVVVARLLIEHYAHRYGADDDG